jgi:heat shock protein HslJ
MRVEMLLPLAQVRCRDTLMTMLDGYERVLAISAGVLATIAALACSAEDGEAELRGRMFQLESAAGIDVLSGTTPWLRFSEQSVAFSGGCNTFTGSFHAAGAVLEVTVETVTMMGCSDALMDQDEWFKTFFVGRPSFEVDGARLELTKGAAALTYLEADAAGANLPLVGTAWYIDTLRRNALASAVPDGLELPLSFTEDGSFSAGSGCYTVSGAYGMQSEGLVFSAVGTTGESCDDPDTAAHIQEVFSVGSASYAISQDRLTVDSGGYGVTATVR